MPSFIHVSEQQIRPEANPGSKASWQQELHNFSLLTFVGDLLLLNLSFFLMNFLKRGTFIPHDIYFNLLVLLNVSWLVISPFMGKFHLKHYYNFKEGALFLTRNIFVLLYGMAVTMMALHIYAHSRLQFFGIFGIYFILSVTMFGLFYLSAGRQMIVRLNGHLQEQIIPRRIRLRRLLLDGLLLVIAFLAAHFFKRETLFLSDEAEKQLLILIGVWLVSGVITRKFESRVYRNVYHGLAPFFKAFLLMAALMSLTMFAMDLRDYSRLLLLGTLGLFFVLEAVMYMATRRMGNRDNGDILQAEQVREVLEREREQQDADMRLYSEPVTPVSERLEEILRGDFSDMYRFIGRHIDLKQIDESETAVVNTSARFNISVLRDHSQLLIINLHKINDFRWLNRYFLEVHRKIYNGGYLVGQVHTIDTHHRHIFSKYPAIMAQMIYPLDFFFRRLLPKLPGLRRVYFFLTRGRNRLLSKAEALGRLYFCGFKVIAAEEIGERLFFIAQRVKNPSLERNPSYGTLIKLKRIGLDGRTFYIRKFRTMHPYSEFLQEYLYENHKLHDTGKFKDDFRVTGWGKVFRRLWIDELPQILNYMQGDVNLVGVRALSQHYFNLYPAEMQEMRVRFKPGLIPPFYADMPQSFEDIVASERRYLELKGKAPFRTDITYFLRAVYNILFRQARSQ